MKKIKKKYLRQIIYLDIIKIMNISSAIIIEIFK